MMAAEKDRLTVTHGDEMADKLEQMKQAEGIDSDARAGRELLQRGLEDWQREHTSYPGSDIVERGIEVSAVGFVVGIVVTLVTGGGFALGESMALGTVVIGFVAAHYSALLMQQRGDI